jgi:hypothetical protein
MPKCEQLQPKAAPNKERTCMKRPLLIALFLAVCAMVVGCASNPPGLAYGHQLEFRRQLFRSAPVVEYGYAVKELRFSKDYQQALVVFAHSDSKSRPDWEFTLNADVFGRYRGTSFPPFTLPGAVGPTAVTVDLQTK